MKRIVLFIVATFFMLGLAAQTPHLKFMGIPLDGTIDDFQEQLIQKGFILDEEYNKKYVTFNYRYKNGILWGEEVSLYLQVNPSTKIICCVLAEISSKDEDYLMGIYNKFKQKVADTYANYSTILHTDFFRGRECRHYEIKDGREETLIGDVYITIAEDPVYDSTTEIKTLSIKFQDFANFHKRAENRKRRFVSECGTIERLPLSDSKKHTDRK